MKKNKNAKHVVGCGLYPLVARGSVLFMIKDDDVKVVLGNHLTQANAHHAKSNDAAYVSRIYMSDGDSIIIATDFDNHINNVYMASELPNDLVTKLSMGLSVY